MSDFDDLDAEDSGELDAEALYDTVECEDEEAALSLIERGHTVATI